MSVAMILDYEKRRRKAVREARLIYWFTIADTALVFVILYKVLSFFGDSYAK